METEARNKEQLRKPFSRFTPAKAAGPRQHLYVRILFPFFKKQTSPRVVVRGEKGNRGATGDFVQDMKRVTQDYQVQGRRHARRKNKIWRKLRGPLCSCREMVPTRTSNWKTAELIMTWNSKSYGGHFY